MQMLKGILPNRVIISYIFDYVIIIVFIIAFSALDKAEPHHQRFSLDNKSLQYPFADPERVPPWLAALVACAFPMLVIIIWTLFIDGLYSHHKTPLARHRWARYTMPERLWEMNAGILGLGLSVAAVITVTGALKNLTGKPRPDIIARCDPDPAWIEPKVGLTSYDQCRGDRYILKDGFKSWPSGHSSTAFAGLGYLSLYLAGKLHILDNRGEVWKTVLILVPLLAASMISISRIMDARHHPFDVISSSILGVFTAWVSYRQYFPPLSQTHLKGRAHPMRSWGKGDQSLNALDSGDGFIRAPNEEEGKAGYQMNMRGLSTGASGAPMTEGGMAADAAQRRRTSPIQPTLPPATDATYFPTASHDEEYLSEDADTYEMREQRGIPAQADAVYQQYGSRAIGAPPHRRNTQSTQGSHESEDRKQAIAAATSAVAGQNLPFDPIAEEYQRSGTTGYSPPGRQTGASSSGDGFTKVLGTGGTGDSPKGVE